MPSRSSPAQLIEQDIRDLATALAHSFDRPREPLVRLPLPKEGFEHMRSVQEVSAFLLEYRGRHLRKQLHRHSWPDLPARVKPAMARRSTQRFPRRLVPIALPRPEEQGKFDCSLHTRASPYESPKETLSAVDNPDSA